MTGHLIVGVDPGTNTGIATWDVFARKLGTVETMGIVSAMVLVEAMLRFGSLHSVVIEDARLRTFFGSKGREALQGAGSIKRDCSIWTEFCELHKIPMRSVSPQAKGAKVDAERFAKLTGWTGRTSNHARDAAMLVFGR